MPTPTATAKTVAIAPSADSGGRLSRINVGLVNIVSPDRIEGCNVPAMPDMKLATNAARPTHQPEG